MVIHCLSMTKINIHPPFSHSINRKSPELSYIALFMDMKAINKNYEKNSLLRVKLEEVYLFLFAIRARLGNGSTFSPSPLSSGTCTPKSAIHLPSMPI